MIVDNKRGNITSNKFVQLEPIPDPNDELTNVFPLISGSANQYVNETQRVKQNLNTIDNYLIGTQFKVKAEVQNDCGDTAYGYITFGRIANPTIGDATIT
jgi:hypothetical protein